MPLALDMSMIVTGGFKFENEGMEFPSPQQQDSICSMILLHGGDCGATGDTEKVRNKNVALFTSDGKRHLTPTSEYHHVHYVLDVRRA